MTFSRFCFAEVEDETDQIVFCRRSLIPVFSAVLYDVRHNLVPRAGALLNFKGKSPGKEAGKKAGNEVGVVTVYLIKFPYVASERFPLTNK